jgi:zinc protease
MRRILTIALSGIVLASVTYVIVQARSTDDHTSQDVVTEAQAPLPTKTFNAETFTLDNGLEIVVIPNHRAPVITHMVWYKAGRADEKPGVSGIAHFLEHLMFKGSDGLAAGDFSEIVRSLGGNDNAFTSQDYTAYYQSIAVEHLETVMKMEAGRMRGLNPPLEEVESERLVIMEERRQRTDNNPRGRFAEQFNAARYVNHPYGVPVIGWMHEIEQLTWDDAKEFYDRHYGPNNAILIVSGDVTGEQVYTLAQEIYGGLERVDIPAREWTQMPPFSGSIHLTMRDADIRQAVIQQSFRAPSYRENKQESLALNVLQEIMGGGPTSRLYNALVVEQKLASSAGMSYGGQSWSTSDVFVYAVPLPGISPDTVKRALEEQLRILIREGVSAQELNDAKTRMQNAAIYARDSLTGPAMAFGQALTSGASVDDVEYWPHYIGQVTAQQIQDAAKLYLDPDRTFPYPPVTGYMLPPDVTPVAPTAIEADDTNEGEAQEAEQ